MRNRPTRDRGVTEVLGFILLFSVVLLSIVAVSILGTNALHDGRDTVVTDNVQGGFIGMANTADDIYQDNAPHRSVTLQMGRGQMGLGDPVHFNVTIDGTHVANTTSRPIVFTLGDSKLVYEGTAVFREERQGIANIREPDFRLDDQRVIIPAVELTPRSNRSIGGRTTVDMVQRSSSVNWTEGDDIDVELEIDTATENRAEAWQRTLEDMRSSWDSCSPSGTVVTCSYDTDSDARVLVHNVTINYDLVT